MKKICTACGLNKFEDQFPIRNDVNDGRAAECLVCHADAGNHRRQTSDSSRWQNRCVSYYPEGTDLRYTPISHERERELFAAARTGDADAREFLIKNHLLFALNQGRSWSRGKLLEDEVASAANYALIQSFERFDHTRETRFTSFLRPAIRGAIARLWRSKNATDMPTFPDKDATAKPPAEEWVGHPVEADDHAEFLMRTLDSAKGVLTEREAEVVRLLFGEEKLDMADIAELKGLSRERIRQIKEAALMKLRREMKRRMDEMGESR